jgi:hypothetical protein
VDGTDDRPSTRASIPSADGPMDGIRTVEGGQSSARRPNGGAGLAGGLDGLDGLDGHIPTMDAPAGEDVDDMEGLDL